MVGAGAKILGVTVEQALEAYGVYFVQYTASQVREVGGNMAWWEMRKRDLLTLCSARCAREGRDDSGGKRLCRGETK